MLRRGEFRVCRRIPASRDNASSKHYIMQPRGTGDGLSFFVSFSLPNLLSKGASGTAWLLTLTTTTSHQSATDMAIPTRRFPSEPKGPAPDETENEWCGRCNPCIRVVKHRVLRATLLFAILPPPVAWRRSSQSWRWSLGGGKRRLDRGGGEASKDLSISGLVRELISVASLPRRQWYVQTCAGCFGVDYADVCGTEYGRRQDGLRICLVGELTKWWSMQSVYVPTHRGKDIPSYFPVTEG